MDKIQVAAALSKHLATRKVSDAVVNALVDDVINVGARPIDIDVCTHGICIDYFVDRRGLGELINKFETLRGLGSIKAFPKGIIDPDKFLVQVERLVER